LFLPEFIVVVNLRPTRTPPPAMGNHLTSSNGVDPDTRGKRDVADRGREVPESYISIVFFLNHFSSLSVSVFASFQLQFFYRRNWQLN